MRSIVAPEVGQIRSYLQKSEKIIEGKSGCVSGSGSGGFAAGANQSASFRRVGERRIPHLGCASWYRWSVRTDPPSHPAFRIKRLALGFSSKKGASPGSQALLGAYS